MTDPTSPTIADFLLARFAEAETEARALYRRALEHDAMIAEHRPQLLGRLIPGWYDWPKVAELASRVLIDLEAKRRIVGLHESWPVLLEGPPEFEQVNTPDGGGALISSRVAFRASQQVAWLTEQEYRSRFGEEPPTAPILRALAAPFSDHPEYREEWA